MAIWGDYNWDFWNPKKEHLKAPTKFRKISICTTCMNRTYDLKETLLKNIHDNRDYPNLEFVLLNYNSKDDLDEWVKNNLNKYIKNKKVVYYKTDQPEYYRMAHSRNIAFKVASGDIINNVDADNFTNKGFATIINMLAELREEKAVFSKGKRLMHGRLGFYKKDFLSLGGYDEELKGYGFDDHNILYRAMNNGYKMMWWGNICKMDRIKTPKGNVTKNMKEKDWKKTEKINKEITFKKIKNNMFNRSRLYRKNLRCMPTRDSI